MSIKKKARRTRTDPPTRRSRTRKRHASQGRPQGTVALTATVQETILACIRGGGFDYVAAEAAGVSARTFRDWISRGEGRHPTRSCTPRLRAFAQDVNRAKAEARLAAEVRVYREDPKHWLSRAARTRPDGEGWTEPRQEAAAPGALGDLDPEASAQEYDGGIHRLLAELLESGSITVPPCDHPRCRCTYHRKRRKEAG